MDVHDCVCESFWKLEESSQEKMKDVTNDELKLKFVGDYQF